MFKKTFNRGFTLIELLVVIAIIGILASVVLASLNTARDKGTDAAAKANINGMRAQAELWYDNQSPNSYSGACGDPNVVAAMADVTASGLTVNCFDESAVGITEGYAILTTLNANSGTDVYCIDYTGDAVQNTTAAISATDVAC